MTRKTLVYSLLGLLIVGALIFAQFGTSRSEANDGGLRTVTIASIAYPYHGQQRYQGQTAIVQEQGWLNAELAKRGIALAWVPVPTAVGGPLINEGFAAKRIDFASYGDFPAIIASSGGIDLRLLVPNGRGQNSYLVVRKGLAANSIADLKGKRIALHRGRPWELPFAKLVEENNLSIKDFRILNINPPASHAALASGDVDAVFLLSDAYLLEQKGVGRIIWSTKQAPAQWRMRAELFARGDLVDQHPEIAQLVTEAYVRAAYWASLPQNRERVIELASASEAPRSVIEADLDDPRVSWRDRVSPLFDDFMIEHYRDVTDYTYREGLVRNRIDVKHLLEPRFAAEALRRLNLEKHWSPLAAQSARAAAPEAKIS